MVCTAIKVVVTVVKEGIALVGGETTALAVVHREAAVKQGATSVRVSISMLNCYLLFTMRGHSSNDTGSSMILNMWCYHYSLFY